MKLSDVFKIPFTKMSWFFPAWMLYHIITLIPGIILWAISLGGFRYFHLSSLLCEYLVDKQIKKEGINGC